MKKLLLVLSLFTMSLSLSACNKDNETLNLAKEQLTISTTLTSNISLPSTIKVEEETVNITWSSSNESVLSSKGIVNKQEKQDIQVILSAELEYNEVTNDKNFVVTVKQKEVEVETPVITISDFLELSLNEECVLEDVLVVSLTPKGFYVTDNTETLFVLEYDYASGVKIGDKVSLEGKRGDYYNLPQMKECTVDIVGTGTITLEPTAMSISDFLLLDPTNQSIYGCYEFTGTVDAGSNLYLRDGDDFVVIYDSSNADSYELLKSYDGQNVTIRVFTNNFHSSNNFWRVCFNDTAADITVN